MLHGMVESLASSAAYRRQVAPVIALVQEQVAAAGWHGQFDEGGSLSKTFFTAVGEKTALLYLRGPRAPENALVLSGDYQSEGSNVLAADSALIPADASEDEVWLIVEQCLTRIEKSIAESYAMHLVRNLTLHTGERHTSYEEAAEELNSLKLNPTVQFAFIASTGWRCMSFRRSAGSSEQSGR